MFWEAISNTRKSVSLDIKTLRSWLRKTRVALRFSTHFSVSGHLMKLSSLCLIYYFKGNSRLVLSDSSVFFLSYTILKRPIALAWKVYHVVNNRELKQPRRRRQQKPHEFAYLTIKNSIFARLARAFFIFWHFEDVLVLSMTWNELFCSCGDDVSIWWQMFNFVSLCLNRWFQFNSKIVRTHLPSIMILTWLKNDCRNAKLHFQMTFSLSSTSCLLKLPIVILIINIITHHLFRLSTL